MYEFRASRSKRPPDKCPADVLKSARAVGAIFSDYPAILFWNHSRRGFTASGVSVFYYFPEICGVIL
jgi:hypothetical protein